MQVIKPQTLGVLHRPYRHAGGDHLCIATLAFFPLGGAAGAHLLADNLQWPAVLQSLDSETPLDMVLPKGSPEVLVAGSAHAPGGKPVTETTVRLSVGAIDKSLCVHGDREWLYGLVPLLQITEPEPFTTLPLAWTRAFGGPRHAENPNGRGQAGRLPALAGANRGPMPNIEYADRPVRRPTGRYRPAGLGPTDIRLKRRRKLAGTYDRDWLENDFPALADDIDWHTFNAAAPDQWVAQPWRGGEAYRLEGMHPGGAIAGNLPRIRPRAFLRRDADAAAVPCPLTADTLWFFPDAGLGLIVHRGTIAIASDDATDVRTLLVAYEDADAPTRPEAHYRETLAARTDPQRAHRHALAEWQLAPVPPAADAATGEPPESSPFLESLLDEIEQFHDIDRDAVKEGPADLDLPGAPAPDALARGDADLGAILDHAQRRADEIRRDADERLAALRAEVEAAGQSLDADPAAPGDADAIAEQQVDALKRARGEDDALRLLDGLIQQAGSDADTDTIAAGQREARRQSPDPIYPTEPLHANAKAALRRFVEQCLAAGAPLAGRDLAGADLHGLDLSGQDLRGIQLEHARLDGARLAGADLRGAVFTAADLRGMDATNARLEGANLARVRASAAVLRGARLDDAMLMHADLADAILDAAVLDRCLGHELQAPRASFRQARATKAILSYAAMPASIWCGARLEQPILVAADVTGADFGAIDSDRLILLQAKAADTRWVDARLECLQAAGGTVLTGADFRGARARQCGLRGADLRTARLDTATFAECDLGETDLTEASAGQAVFYRSLLTGATLIRTDLHGANLHQAQLRRADCTGADLRDAATAGADWQGADLTDARLDRGVRPRGTTRGATAA